jgi:hypothetical protein
MSFNYGSCKHQYYVHEKEIAVRILKDLWAIFSKHLGPMPFQVRWHLKTFSPEEVYVLFAAKEIYADGVYDRLRQNQIEPFIAFHEGVKEVLAGSEGLPPAFGKDLAEVFFRDPRRFSFAVGQIDVLIERGLLERGVFRKYGKNVIPRKF